MMLALMSPCPIPQVGIAGPGERGRGEGGDAEAQATHALGELAVLVLPSS